MGYVMGDRDGASPPWQSARRRNQTHTVLGREGELWYLATPSSAIFTCTSMLRQSLELILFAK